MKPNTPFFLVATVLLALLPACAASAPIAVSTVTATGTATIAPTVNETATKTATATYSATLSSYSGPVTLQFLGNSCILITAPDGTRIVSDPYGDNAHTFGIDPLPKDLAANAVTVSHSHRDHNNTNAVGGSPRIFKAPGAYQVGMNIVTGYKGYEGSPFGPDTSIRETIFVFEIAGVKIVHLGDSGPVSQADILAAIDNANIVIVSIDQYVIPLEQMMPFLEQIHARTIIPVHYDIDPDGSSSYLDAFLKILPSDLVVVRDESGQIQVTPGMPDEVVVLTPQMQVR